MFQSPPKRRKISPTRSTIADEDYTEQPLRSHPTTPTRASYASPTKSSLARSHPNILSRSPGRSSQALNRGKLLREELLGGRSNQNTREANQRLSNSAPQTPRRRDAATARKQPATTAMAPANDFATAVARAFQVQGHSKPPTRSPLTSRQPSAQNIQRPRESSIDDLPLFVEPKLVTKPTTLLPSISRTRSIDLDLPPTPVQLGLDMPPDRPRGLALSSSPRSGRSGSGKNRRRFRDSVVTSSPLKPKDVAPNLVGKNRVIVEDPQEAPESEFEEPEPEETISDETREKQILRNDLQEQLERLKEEISVLERAQNSTTEFHPHLLSLLTTTNPSCAATPPSVEEDSSTVKLPNPVHLGSNPLPYLTLFAPGNLNLSSRTSTRTTKLNRKLQTMHTFTLTAPSPWPPQIFSAAFDVTADAEEARVESVNLKHQRNGSSLVIHHKPLHGWISKHLQDPLHQKDIGTLVWGMGRYFDGLIGRAKAMKALDLRYKQNRFDDEAFDDDSPRSLTAEDVKTLLPYLTTSQMEIAVSQPSKETLGKRKRTRSAARLLLTWEITLGWTGEAEAKIDLVATGLPRKAVEGVERVWGTLRKRKGAVDALGDVLSLLKGRGDGPQV